MKTPAITSPSEITAQPAAHTPGPWRRNGSLITAQGSMALTVASLPCKEDRICRFPDAAAKDFAQRDANARLIASAPALLDVLILALPYVETAQSDPAYKAGAVARMVRQMRDAIASATGEKGGSAQ